MSILLSREELLDGLVFHAVVGSCCGVIKLWSFVGLNRKTIILDFEAMTWAFWGAEGLE